MNKNENLEYEGFEENIDSSDVDFLSKKQRELITSTIDYNLESLAQLISGETIDLEPKYQRRFRWDPKRKSKLIESFLLNVPIPPIFLNEDDFGAFSVIDGKQRLASISEFLSNELVLTDLKIFSDLNGKSFSDLPKEFQNSLNYRSTLRAIIILRQSDKDIKYEVFQRLNTGGVRLNAQEIRNSAFPGTLNDKIVGLSESNEFHKMLGIKSKEKSRLYQEMRDVELVLRFFALKDSWKTYSGGLKGVLDSYMEVNKELTGDAVDKLESIFIKNIEKVNMVFGEAGAFRRWLPDSNKWKQQISAPLFDAQMFACYGRKKEELVSNREAILKDYKQLFTDDTEFIDSIESSTGTPVRFVYRSKTLYDIIGGYASDE